MHIKRGDKLPEKLQNYNFIHPQDKTENEIKIDGYQLPGILDIHIHGAFGWDFSFGNPEKINNLLDNLLGTGLTGIIPTIITCEEAQRLQALKDIKQVAETRQALPRIHGIHLEGPYLSPEKKGSHSASLLKTPLIKDLEKWQEAAGGMIKIITIAPELPGAIEFIEAAAKQGIICSIGHSNANADITEKAIAAGAKHVTHLFNAMPALHHRSPNLLSTVLGNQKLSVELIADGAHVSPEIMDLVYKLYEDDQVILTSDAVAPAGLENGTYEFYGTKLEKHNGTCCFQNGHLFGGSKPLTACLKKLTEESNISWGLIGISIWRNPYKLLNIEPPETEILFDTKMNWLASRINDTWYWKQD